MPTPSVSPEPALPLPPPESFADRHLGPRPAEIQAMLESLGSASLDELIAETVPASLQLRRPLDLPPPRTEHQALADLRAIAGRNRMCRSYLGMGYYDTLLPPVLQRNVLENPGWYTQYTPYQAEISQGRLEALLHFQTLICELTGLEIANASLLDEATAAAEAMALAYHLKSAEGRNAFLVADSCHPQNIQVVQTRAEPLGIEVIVAAPARFEFGPRLLGILLQYPDTYGSIRHLQPCVDQAHAAGALAIVATDLLSLVLLNPPGQFGADIAVGSAQRFGIPLAYGGPHAAFFATRHAFRRLLPGRLVGVSKDSRGKPALRLALQTREQHIRREKATSNICTAQALLANLAALYAIYHGPAGLRRIARRVHGLTRILATGLERLGCRIQPAPAGSSAPASVPESPAYFDTLCIQPTKQVSLDILRTAATQNINLRSIDRQTLGISLDETTTESEVDRLFRIFNGDQPPPFTAADLAPDVEPNIPPSLARSTPFLEQPVFNRYHSETDMLRYLKRLESRDLSLTSSMIPLGSCTMKLNAACEMIPITWPEFSQLHPFAPPDQAAGYEILFQQLETWLAEITGFAAVSLQPNAGSQGEYAGLLVLRAYHRSRGQSQRKVCLIPTSAHGTNPASAVMAGLTVVPVACDPSGNIDLADLRAKAATHERDLAALMVTYPSTHGVFEEAIEEVCQTIHQHGGQVYLDGANMNAQVGLCRPADFGADVCHLNLHKTFCIPHGGGGPGVGPICVASHLAPFLPGHPIVSPRPGPGTSAVAGAPWGSAGVLPISWVYLAAMGAAGLKQATQVAILNANYIASRLDPYFPVLYRGQRGRVAHECILDLRSYRTVTVEDVAKRLMDFGFHAPTISWPVAGTLMIEPTESESKPELDRFCDALIAIHAEILELESGRADPQNNLLKNAPHTAEQVAANSWNYPYPREQAAFPVASLKDHKFWPPVGRIDNVYGDRHPVCTCAGIDAYLT